MFGFGVKTDKDIKQLVEEEQKELEENHLKWQYYLTAVLFVLIGTVFIVYAQIDISFICKFMACVFAVAGVITIATYCIRDVASGYYRLDLVYGVISIFAALVFYTKQDVIGTYFPVIVGFILFANGVTKLQHSIDMKRIDRKMKKVTEIWLVVMIFALICIAAGFIAVYMKSENIRTMFVFIGIAFIVAGASDVFTHIVFNRKVRLFRSGDYITEEKDKEEEKDKPESKPGHDQPKKDEIPEEEPLVIKPEEENTEENVPDKDTIETVTEDMEAENPEAEEETAKDATDPQT